MAHYSCMMLQIDIMLPIKLRSVQYLTTQQICSFYTYIGILDLRNRRSKVQQVQLYFHNSKPRYTQKSSTHNISRPLLTATNTEQDSNVKNAIVPDIAENQADNESHYRHEDDSDHDEDQLSNDENPEENALIRGEEEPPLRT